MDGDVPVVSPLQRSGHLLPDNLGLQPRGFIVLSPPGKAFVEGQQNLTRFHTLDLIVRKFVQINAVFLT